jgi:hypothetical protein
MKPQDFEKYLNEFKFDDKPSQVHRDELEKKLLNTLSNRTQHKTISIWHFNNRVIKFAAAAAVLIAALLGLNYFGRSISLTTVAFADMANAMKTEPWVHIKSSGLSAGTSGPSELWVSFKSKINAAKTLNGQVTFINLNEHKSYTYEPNNHSITMDYVYETDYPEYFSSPVSIVESMNRQLEAQGAKITTSISEYKGQKVILQQTTLSVNNSGYSVNLYIQPESKLLLCAQVQTTDSGGNSKEPGEISFDYPQTGPSDIYALGVPRDASIIDKFPSKDFMAIWDNYRRVCDEATQKYIAVITHIPDVIDMVDIDYKSGENHRFERHFVFKIGQGSAFWLQYKEQLGDSFDSLLEWTQAHYKDIGYISVSFYNGQYEYATSRDDKGNWSEIRKSRSDRSLLPNETLADISWPSIGKTGHIIEDDYAKQNNLICIERLQQGSILRDVVSQPSRFLFYLDPKKDYLCMRKVIEWRPDADWQEDKKWLDGIAPDKIRDGSITVTDITEAIQAQNGHWYPKTIEEKQTGISKDYKEKSLKVRKIKKVYIQTNPEFSEDVFDSGKFPEL